MRYLPEFRPYSPYRNPSIPPPFSAKGLCGSYMGAQGKWGKSMETTRFLRFNADNHSDPLTTYNEDRQQDTVISHGGYKFLRAERLLWRGGDMSTPQQRSQDQDLTCSR